jgi:hypothetical protein
MTLQSTAKTIRKEVRRSSGFAVRVSINAFTVSADYMNALVIEIKGI